MKKIFFLPFLHLLFIGCSNNKEKVFTDDNEATYNVSVNFNWSTSNHPEGLGGFPSSAHFSPVVASTHKDGKSIYTRGELASSGIKQMAETGKTALLSGEIDAQINEKEVLAKLIASGSTQAEENKDFGTIKASKDFHYLSLVSMIAPSPDWFIAKRNINLREDGKSWTKTITIELKGYDAGTDSGEEFTSSDSQTDPKENIILFPDSKNVVFAILILTRLDSSINRSE